MSEIGTPRQRARAQTIVDIKRIAREQLATEGSAALSLRAIARELGIVSSAVYRYVPSRDELLTMLIEDAYTALGAAATTADRRCRRSDLGKRWIAIGRAVRGWALANRAEYALIYGSPVPGYAAPPERTIAPGSIVTRLLVDILAAANTSGGALPDLGPAPTPAPLQRDLATIRDGLGVEVDDELLSRGLLAWTALFGMVSFELFGQYANSVEHGTAFFDHQLTRLAQYLGLPLP